MPVHGPKHAEHGGDVAPAGPAGSAAPDISRDKACQMLKDGKANGQDLTPPQRRLFGAICNGQQLQQAETGALIFDHGGDAISTAMAEVYLEDPAFLGSLK